MTGFRERVSNLIYSAEDINTNPAMTYIGKAVPKTPFGDRGFNELTSENFHNMDAYLAAYRRDSITRNSIDALGFFSTSKGFNAVLDLVNPENKDQDQINKELEQYSELLDFIDESNRAVNLDDVSRKGVVRMKIYGWSGHEIIIDTNGKPSRMLARKMERSNKNNNRGVVPRLDPVKGVLTGYDFMSKDKDVFEPQEMLFFVNNELNDDLVGLSDIEPVFDQVATKRFIMNEAVKEVSKSLWSPYITVKVNTGKATSDNAKRILSDVRQSLKPGLPLVHNQDIESDVIDQKPPIDKLMMAVEEINDEIIGNFGVPKFLVSREKTLNRATAFAEAAMFLQGKITAIQKYLAREIEGQWYDVLTRDWFKRNKGLRDSEPLPVKVKHIWKPITLNDWKEQVDAWVALIDSGIANRKMALDNLGFDSVEVLKDELDNPEVTAESRSTVHSIKSSDGNEYRVVTHRRGDTKSSLRRYPSA